MSEKGLVPVERIERSILVIRVQKVILDTDLARLYGTTTKRLNEQIRRNRRRFPGDFVFQLTVAEAESGRCHVLGPRRAARTSCSAPRNLTLICLHVA